ncbi:hypothetical protein GC425_05065 [Corynebacterium sp. zg254]|uniref:Uncharacterized protein n=1 Tax=Corynebacterium zhongnanshanii TaxID=2768834 RepID=A0ABQ6VFX3_9CORY|nr:MULTISPECIES: hypothetical protein [Corynebacterium]KAB3522708.1 hypothetical protein F8377_00545 [Corynebacterium zhongnanshanii]MCR5914237.1 hypothetical protein [Corynebacterium sp. zg254]
MSESVQTETVEQRRARARQHYELASAGTAVGLGLLILAVLGFLGVGGLATIIPWTLVISLFFLIPGIAGVVRGPGQPSTYIIPRPQQRTRMRGTAAAR